MSSVTGTCVDEQDKPLTNAVLRFTDPSNGRHFEVKSDADGKFAYIAVEPSYYRLDIIRDRRPNVSFPPIFLQWSSQPLIVELNLQTNSLRVTRQVKLSETFGTEEPALSAVVSGGGGEEKARALNQQIASIKSFVDQGDWENALTAAKAATELDPNRDLSWAWLASVYCAKASQTESTTNLLQNCIENYKRAIAISPSATYYNNIGAAYSSLKAWNDAVESFQAAVQSGGNASPLYHENLGAALFNLSESVEDKARLQTLQRARKEFAAVVSAASAANSEAFYWLGLCDLRLAAATDSGSTYDSADQAFRRYLQLSPGGRFSAEARAMVNGLLEFLRASPTK